MAPQISSRCLGTFLTENDVSILPHLRPGDNRFIFLLSQRLKMRDMSTKRLKHCILVVISHTKLLACLDYDRSYLWIVNLSYIWEQVVCSLVVRSSWKKKRKTKTKKRLTCSMSFYEQLQIQSLTVSRCLHVPVKTFKTNYPLRNLGLTQSVALPYNKIKWTYLWQVLPRRQKEAFKVACQKNLFGN